LLLADSWSNGNASVSIQFGLQASGQSDSNPQPPAWEADILKMTLNYARNKNF